jgi:transcriptional regulator with XRE-family HTH domain
MEESLFIWKGVVMVKGTGEEFRHDRLLTLIEANDMTVREVADNVKVTKQMVYRWVNGLSIPGIKALIALCHLFKVDMNFFFPSMRKVRLEAISI